MKPEDRKKPRRATSEIPIIAYEKEDIEPNDVFAGILLTIGLYAVLTGIAFAVSKIGLNIIKD
jgi:hypothetical protein